MYIVGRLGGARVARPGPAPGGAGRAAPAGRLGARRPRGPRRAANAGGPPHAAPRSGRARARASAGAPRAGGRQAAPAAPRRRGCGPGEGRQRGPDRRAESLAPAAGDCGKGDPARIPCQPAAAVFAAWPASADGAARRATAFPACAGIFVPPSPPPRRVLRPRDRVHHRIQEDRSHLGIRMRAPARVGHEDPVHKP